MSANIEKFAGLTDIELASNDEIRKKRKEKWWK